MKGAPLAALTALLLAASTAVAVAAPPDRPTNVRRTRVSNTEVLLTWHDNSDNETGFEILRRAALHKNFQSRGTVPANAEEFTDTVERGTVYTYRVRAYNGDGDSDDSNDCLVGRTPPNIPIGVKARFIALTVVRVTWADVSQTESGFQIQRAAEGKGFQTVATVPANTEKWDDEGLNSAHTYTYRVRALGRPGVCIDNSKYSVERTVTTKGGVRILTVDVTGNGKGTVVSIPEGIHCGPLRASCSAEFPTATTITLLAEPTASSRFKEWLDVPACVGNDTSCSFNLGKDRVIGAVFKKKVLK
ncbi:MAG: fibronectin type III domain-containing protein [Deltaproteobacteria bacterium]|nr:fibronectin type III domain-containing protein [Deltaproteobacteria bacterium]